MVLLVATLIAPLVGVTETITGAGCAGAIRVVERAAAKARN